jgi:hypothetical protein
MFSGSHSSKKPAGVTSSLGRGINIFSPLIFATSGLK